MTAPGGPPVPVAPASPAVRSLGFAREAMRGEWLGAAASELGFAGAAADSRRVRRGELFFALPGERVDGHDFCAAAVGLGAVALVVDARRGRPPGLPAAGGAGGAEIPVIGVADPIAALGDLAQAARAAFTGRVVGITGSNGKTTTKELTAAALGVFGAVYRTEGNYNTDIGLPLTILGATGREAFWVLEMAMRGRGQIARLAEIAAPHVGVITNVAGAHLELLGSIEEVARAKGELFAGLAPEGIAVLPGFAPLVEAQAAALSERRKLRFDDGTSPRAAVADAVDVAILDSQPAGRNGQVVRYAVRRQPVVARLPLGGRHNAGNGAAALGVAAALGLPAPAAAQALAATVLPPHRSLAIETAGRVVLDDCYNANPASMRAALAAVTASAASAGAGARAFAILGDMLELGQDAPALHRAIGREAAGCLAGLAAVGPLSVELGHGAREGGLPAGRIFVGDDPAAAAAAVAAWTRPGDWILVKASRGMRLERAVDALSEEFRGRAHMA